MDRVVQSSWVEGDADGDERVHLVVLLGDGVILGGFLEVLRPRHVHQDMAEHPDGVGVAAHHHVGEPDVVVRGKMGGHDAGEHGFFVELDVIQCLQREAEVAQKAVDPQEADDGEIAEQSIQRSRSIFARYSGRIFVAFDGGELLIDLGSLDERIQDVENAVTSPRVWILFEKLDLFAVIPFSGKTMPIATEAVELIDEFVNHIPCPIRL